MARKKRIPEMTEIVDEQPVTIEAEAEQPSGPNIVRLEHRIPKKRLFLADAVRDERDTAALHVELRKPCYKGRVVKVTTIKHYEPVGDCWLTEFEIETKE